MSAYYFVRLHPYNASSVGDNSQYRLRIDEPIGEFDGKVVGQIIDETGTGIKSVNRS